MEKTRFNDTASYMTLYARYDLELALENSIFDDRNTCRDCTLVEKVDAGEEVVLWFYVPELFDVVEIRHSDLEHAPVLTDEWELLQKTLDEKTRGQ